MSKFNITKKINLHPVLGEGHEQSVLEFKPMTFADAKQLDGLQSDEDFTPVIPQGATAEQIKKLTAEAKARESKSTMQALDKAIDFIKGKFIKGEIAGTAVEADDFTNGNLPVDVINYCMSELAGGKPEDFTKA